MGLISCGPARQLVTQGKEEGEALGRLDKGESLDT